MHELRQSYPVAAMLRLVSLAPSTFYAWDAARETPDKYARAKELIKQIYDEHKGRYGYRRIACALKEYGIELHANTVRRLMGLLGLKSVQRIKRYKSYKGSVGVVAPNHLERDFSATYRVQGRRPEGLSLEHQRLVYPGDRGSRDELATDDGAGQFDAEEGACHARTRPGADPAFRSRMALPDAGIS